MGTVKLPSKAHAAVLVDYELLIKRPHLTDFIIATADRVEDVQWVLLVTDPTEDAPDLIPDFEWDVVIQNTGYLHYEPFHTHAVHAVENFSNLIPVMALADNGTERVWYHDNSDVLVVLSE